MYLYKSICTDIGVMLVIMLVKLCFLGLHIESSKVKEKGKEKKKHRKQWGHV